MNYNAQHISVLKVLAFMLYQLVPTRARGEVSLHMEKTKNHQTFHQISPFKLLALEKKKERICHRYEYK